MNRLSSELLLNTFKALDDNREIVKARLCCRAWSEIINENRQLWRKIDLLDIHDRWELIVLDLFDKRSQSTLVEINLRSSLLSASKVSHLIQVLSRSKETLKTLRLTNSFPTMPKRYGEPMLTWLKEINEYHRLRTELSGLSSKLPHLQDSRLTSASPGSKTNVSIHKTNSRAKGRSGCFQVLWATSYKDLLTSHLHLHLLDNLSSFSIATSESVNWSKILGPCSRGLKHLSISVALGDEGSPILQLPSLEVLELRGGQPSWMITPLTCLVILNGTSIPVVTPNASHLWVGSLSGWENLAGGSPSLEELRIELVFTSASLRCAVLLVRQRKGNVEADLEADGIRMRPLKKLIISFNDLKPSELQELRELVEEVVDLATVPELVEVVI